VLEGVRKIRAWELTHHLVVETYRITRKFPREELFGLTSQMRRAAVSAAANIVEGSQRQYVKEYVQFLYVSKGSLAELEYYIFLSNALGYITEEEMEKLDVLRREAAKTLQGLINWLEERMAAGAKTKDDLQRARREK